MIRFGIIGIGAIARDYIGLTVCNTMQGKLVAISSRNQKNMDEVIEQYQLKGVKTYTDYKEMLTSGEVDGVIICTPHNTHIEIAKECMIAGIHPLIEKPIAIQYEEAAEFLEFTKNYPNITAGVAYCNRMANGFYRVKQMIEEGAVGKMKRYQMIATNYYRTQAYHNSASWRGTYEYEGGGVLMTQASHPLDILCWICGMPESVTGFCIQGTNRGIEVENDVHIHMQFKVGFTAQFTTSSHELPGTNRLEITGDRGQIILEDGFHLTYRTWDVDEPEYAKTATGWFAEQEVRTEIIPIQEESILEYQKKIINDFLGHIENGGTPICSVREAVDSLKIIKAVYQSSKEKRTIIIN